MFIFLSWWAKLHLIVLFVFWKLFCDLFIDLWWIDILIVLLFSWHSHGPFGKDLLGTFRHTSLLSQLFNLPILILPFLLLQLFLLTDFLLLPTIQVLKIPFLRLGIWIYLRSIWKPFFILLLLRSFPLIVLFFCFFELHKTINKVKGFPRKRSGFFDYF